MGKGRGLYRILVGKLEGKRQLGRTRTIIIRWIFRKWDVGEWTGFSWRRLETVGGHL
jgi:hypothetical protein